jgi:uncharacterized membrane protein YccC
LALFRKQLADLDTETRTLLDCVRDIKGTGHVASHATPGAGAAPGFLLDPDRSRSVVTVLATMWSAFLVWVYADPPAHGMFVFFTTQWMLMAMLGGMRVQLLFTPMIIGMVSGGIAYVLIMPHLSSFAGLGVLLFCAIFGGFYFFWEPRLRALRGGFAAIFLSTISVSNQQSYSFAGYANTCVAILLTLALATVVSYVPSSPRPEKVFLRLLTRFFRQSELLMSRLASGRADPGFLQRRRDVWYRSDLLELPKKLVALAERRRRSRPSAWTRATRRTMPIAIATP